MEAAGPEAVAQEIEKIRALFELEKRIEELEAEALKLRSRKLRPIQQAILGFTEAWESTEPDQLKVIVGLLPENAA